MVLFAHIAVILLALALAGAIHTSEWLVPRAATVSEMRALAKPQAWGMLFLPVVALMLLLGSWLVELSEDESVTFSFSDGWVWTAAVVLVLLAVAGGAVEGPHAERLGKALAEAPDGPPTPEIRALAAERLNWMVGHASPFAVLGVVSNMVNKPGTPVSILVIVVAVLIGAGIGLVGSRQARGTSLPAPQP